jgi:hypothetical protein
VEELKRLIPALSQMHPSIAQNIVDTAEVFGVDTTDRRALMVLIERYVRSFDNPAEFRDELDSRDTNGFTPLHCAVMQGKADLVDYFISDCGADPSEYVAGIAYREVAARSIGVRNKQAILDNNPHAGRNAFTLAITCKANDTIYYLAKHEVNGQKMVNLRDGRGDTAVCLAVEHNEDCLPYVLAVHHEAAWIANGEGVKPLELAIKKGKIFALNCVLSTYSLAMGEMGPQTMWKASLDLKNAACIVATCWTDLPNREAILKCLLSIHTRNFRANDGRFVGTSFCPVAPCVDVLFDEALKRIGSEPDSYNLLEVCTADQIGRRDYSLFQALLKCQAHDHLDIEDQELLLLALANNEIAIDLCRKAGVGQVSSSSESDSDA